MRKILIATHGEFAGGLKQTMDFVLGGNEKVGVLSAYTTPDFDMGREAAAVVDELEDGDELIVLTDVLGGSVANAFSGHISHPGVYVLAGVNAPMLLAMVPYAGERHGYPGADYTGNTGSQGRVCVYQRSDEAGF